MSKKDNLIKLCGKENVFDAPDILERYIKTQSFTRGVTPQFVVSPKNGKQVQELIKWANDTLTPLIPVSSASPHLRGDSAPSTAGAIMVDLGNMRKIIRVDSGNRVAMVEPGVTFSELIPVLEKANLRMNMLLLPRSGKSVIGSMLEREPVTMPKYHWDIADPLLCTEIIFGTGDLFRTGSAAGPGTLEEQWELGAAQEIPSGPSQIDWYRLIQAAQGTMGIVTWATVRCERLPKLEEAFLVGVSDLREITELIHWLLRLRLVNECLVLDNTNLAAILSKFNPDEFIKLREDLPSWLLLFCIAGYEYFPEERVSYQIEEMMTAAKKVGVTPVKTINGIMSSELLKTLKLPSDEPYWKLRPKGSFYDIFFLTVPEKIPEFVEIMYKIAATHNYPSSDIGIYIQPIVQGTSCHCEFSLFFNPNEETELDKIHKLSVDAVERLMANGAFFSRPYDFWADLAYRRDAGTAAALKKIKGIFDPNNIMNPGKLCFQKNSRR